MVRSMAPLFRQVQDPDGRVCQFQEVTMNQLHMTETTTVMTMAVMEKANVVPVSTGLLSAIVSAIEMNTIVNPAEQAYTQLQTVIVTSMEIVTENMNENVVVVRIVFHVPFAP